MINCAIIGAGQIGSRHLQALAQLNSPARIELVDSEPMALKMSEKRFLEVAQRSSKLTELTLNKDIESLTRCLDIVIIATHANIRAQILDKVVNEKSVKNLILEKVLFQKPKEYRAIYKTLKKKEIPTWVNCWMRTTALFKQVKSVLNLNNSIHLKVKGSQWSMGSSSIHFMDLFSYFTESSDFKFTDIQLSNKLIDSKRSGFKEFSGKMMGGNKRGDTLSLICLGPEDESPTIEIMNGSHKYHITRLVGEVEFKSNNDFFKNIKVTSLPYQSQLTHIWVNHILGKGSCDLPTYKESMPLHLEMIRVFNEHFEKITGTKVEACPIT